MRLLTMIFHYETISYNHHGTGWYKNMEAGVGIEPALTELQSAA